MCVNIIVVGPNNLFREGLIRILGAADFQILDAVSSIDAPFLETLTIHDDILFILDAGDSSREMLEQVRLIKAQKLSWRVVVLDSNNQLANAASAYRAGASAFFANVATSATFIKYLELVMLGETIIPAAFLRMALEREARDEPGGGRRDGELESKGNGKEEPSGSPDPSPMQQLSAREKTILRCIIEGCSNKAIARRVAISEATVKVHVKSILRKFRVHSRTQAAIWGMSCSPSQWDIDDVAAFSQITAHSSASQHALPALPQAARSETSLF